jgi:hypothetical protein
MGPERTERLDLEPVAVDPGEPGTTEYLDLDGDGVPDAIETTRTRTGESPSGAAVVEEIRELDSDIGLDGVPTTVTVTDTVAVDANHRGVPNVVEVVKVVTHPAANPDDRLQPTDPDERRGSS